MHQWLEALQLGDLATGLGKDLLYFAPELVLCFTIVVMLLLRLVPRKAARLAEDALALASGDLERTDALESLAEAFLVAFTGDLAWRYFREAALVRDAAQPPDASRTEIATI